MGRETIEISRPARIGVALGGGAALGWSHIGVLRVLAAAGIRPDVYAGTSIGAIVAAADVLGALDTLEEIARSMSWRRMLAFADPQVSGPGLLKGQALMDEFTRRLGDWMIEDLPRPYVAVASDLIAGQEVQIQRGRLADAVRASISLPGIFIPVERDGALLVDGGMTNPVPATAARRLGADIVIAVNVTGDYAGRARAAGIDLDRIRRRTLPAVPARSIADHLRAFGRRIAARSPRRPGMYAVAMSSAALIMRELAASRLALDPPEVVLVPEIGHISPADFDRAGELISAGAAAMNAKLEELQALIEAPRAGAPRQLPLGA